MQEQYKPDIETKRQGPTYREVVFSSQGKLLLFNSFLSFLSFYLDISLTPYSSSLLCEVIIWMEALISSALGIQWETLITSFRALGGGFGSCISN